MDKSLSMSSFFLSDEAVDEVFFSALLLREEVDEDTLSIDRIDEHKEEEVTPCLFWGGLLRSAGERDAVKAIVVEH